MQTNCFVKTFMVFCTLGMLLVASIGFAADVKDAVVIDVQSASGKVGQPTAIEIRITPQNNFKISKAYRNRVFELSALDDSVEFDGRVIRGSIKDGELLFSVGVTPKTPGDHAINGIIRFGFLADGRVDFKSIPLITTVTGTE